ncbi:hypothetical protein BDZ90DRAFT_231130 [Jaminaea rosea]|uniref:DH domain-containing protein n=1 Tax=Jaminaea rosea TaxID=1569628 RepID=A0A316UXV7_9BASI|nr:hypothetical protein BDZ90DRAFT_231130 [Jaminaea rosea]PWN29131.1 hypothetical protein BDZ90DRAFT_231130 [Jaminaea rosea]
MAGDSAVAVSASAADETATSNAQPPAPPPPPLVRNASFLSEEPSSSSSASSVVSSSRARRPSSSSTATVGSRRRPSRTQLGDPPSSPGGSPRPSSRKTILRGTLQATVQDRDREATISSRSDSQESGTSSFFESEGAQRSRSGSGRPLAEASSPRSPMTALWEANNAHGSPVTWTSSRRPSAASSGGASRGSGRRRGSNAAGASSSAAEDDGENPPPPPIPTKQLGRDRMASASSSTSSLTRRRAADLEAASTDSSNGFLMAPPPTMMGRMRSKTSRENVSEAVDRHPRASEPVPSSSTLGKLFGGLRKSKNTPRDDSTPSGGDGDGPDFAAAAADASSRPGLATAGGVDEARTMSSSGPPRMPDYQPPPPPTANLQSLLSLPSHPYANSRLPPTSSQGQGRAELKQEAYSEAPRADGMPGADLDWTTTTPTPTNASFAVTGPSQSPAGSPHAASPSVAAEPPSPSQSSSPPTMKRAGSWPPRGDKKPGSFVTLQNGQSRGVGGSRFQNAASRPPRTPSPNTIAMAQSSESAPLPQPFTMSISNSASSDMTSTTAGTSTSGAAQTYDAATLPALEQDDGVQPQSPASIAAREERCRIRRERKSLRSRPQSGQSSSSWHIPLPRSSSLRSYDGETGPFPTPPPRSSSSGMQEFDFSGSYGAGEASTSPRQMLSVDQPSPLPSPRSLPRAAPASPRAAPYGVGGGSVAKLASKFGGTTRQQMPRGSPEAKQSASSYFERLTRYRSSSNASNTSRRPPSGLGESLSSAEVAAWVTTANGQRTASTSVSTASSDVALRERAPSTVSVYEDAPQTLANTSKDRVLSSIEDDADADPTSESVATESSHPPVMSSDSAASAISNPPNRPTKSSRRPGTAQTLENVERCNSSRPSSSAIPAQGSSINEEGSHGVSAAPAGPSTSPSALGVSPLRNSVEMAARMGGTFDMSQQHAKAGGANGLAEPLVLSNSRNRSESEGSALKEEHGGDEADEHGEEEDEDGDEIGHDVGDGEDATARLEVPSTPGRRRASLATRAKNLRKVTPPALASAFRQRKASAPGEGTLKGKKWPFGGTKDDGSEGEEDSKQQQARLGRASVRKKKDATPARPTIRRIYDDQTGSPLSPAREHLSLLAQKPSIASFQSATSSSQDVASIDRGSDLNSPVVPSPVMGGRVRTPPTAWTKGELDEDMKRILKRRNVIRELVHTERSYASDLTVIRDIYLSRARARVGAWPSASPGTPWSGFSATGSPLHHPASATSSSSYLPYRNAAASRSYFRSASGEVALSAYQGTTPSPGLHRKASSPAMATPPMHFDTKLHPLPSPAPSGSISNRSSVVTSGSKSKDESVSSDATRSSSRPTDASKSGGEERTSVSTRYSESGTTPGVPATPPMPTITTSTSTTSTFQDAHGHMSSLISQGAASRTSGGGTGGIIGGDGTPPAGGRPAVTIDTRSSASTPAGALSSNSSDAPLSHSDIRVIFTGVEACTAFADEMTCLLEASMGTLAANSLPSEAADLEDSNDDTIGLAFRQLASRIQAVYGAYCSKHEASITRLRDVASTSSRAAQFLKECTAVARRRTNAWDLASLLIKPVQRMLKYPLLLKQILAATPSTHPDYENLVMAIEEIQRVADSINELNRRREIITQIIGGGKARDVAGNGGALGSASSPGVEGSSGAQTPGGMTRSLTRNKLNASKTLRRNKASGSTPTVATDLAAVGTNVLESPDLPRLLASFNSLQGGIDRLATEYSRWPTLLRASILSQLDLLAAWKNVYVTETEHLTAFGALCQEMLEGPLPKLDRAVQLTLLPPLEKVRGIFSGPREVLMRREEREEDYIRYRTLLLAKGEQGMRATSLDKEHRRLVESANGFAALHLHLVDELPEFLHGVECMVDLLIAAFARIQAEYLGSVKTLMGGFLEARGDNSTSVPPVTTPSGEAASTASHGSNGTVASSREKTANIVRTWWTAHQVWATQLEGLKVCQPNGETGRRPSASPSLERSPLPSDMNKAASSYSLDKRSGGVGGLAGAVMTGSPANSQRSLPRVSDGGSSQPGASHHSNDAHPPPAMPPSTSSGSVNHEMGSTTSSSYLAPHPQQVPTPGRRSLNSSQGSGGSRRPSGSPSGGGTLDVAAMPASASNNPSPAGSRKGSIFRSLSGTIRGVGSSSTHSDTDTPPRPESPLPPVPPLPGKVAGNGSPAVPPKDHGGSLAPMLPSLDLGEGDWSPEVTAKGLEPMGGGPADGR